MNEQLQGATTQTASAQPLFNPLSPDFIRDPYPSYDKLRTHAPVLHLPALNGYLVSRNADAALVLRDKRFGKDYVTRITRRFGPEALNEPVYRAMGRWMLTQDPPDHTRLRGLVVDQRIGVELRRHQLGPFAQDAMQRVVVRHVEYGDRAAPDPRVDVAAHVVRLIFRDPRPEFLTRRCNFGRAFGARR